MELPIQEEVVAVGPVIAPVAAVKDGVRLIVAQDMEGVEPKALGARRPGLSPVAQVPIDLALHLVQTVEFPPVDLESVPDRQALDVVIRQPTVPIDR